MRTDKAKKKKNKHVPLQTVGLDMGREREITHLPYMGAGFWLEGLGCCPYMLGCGPGWMSNPAFLQRAASPKKNTLYCSIAKIS